MTPQIATLDSQGARRAYPVLTSLLAGTFYSTWEMDYVDAAEAFDDTLEGFCEASARAVRREVAVILKSGADDAAVSGLNLQLYANLDPVIHTGLGGRAFLTSLAEAVVSHKFVPVAGRDRKSGSGSEL